LNPSLHDEKPGFNNLIYDGPLEDELSEKSEEIRFDVLKTRSKE
jgi:hypothetical protein